ncbi:rRNA maturation RNase YbeY [Sporolactobacillus sp. CPB3-1]|uniref:Endoribonuclease YbeY n=1 Tax=Sporolactobacillus mangiferae TaxID=2940498 RepID=A0ABT0M6E6_9BACL|nr:rRNA maturation RNase YbeY [Sporolactobacillus mangiferae]MCL1630412.1 rRNA maturation RNase YbeY [Sporolactobacillus mangiferae]
MTMTIDMHDETGEINDNIQEAVIRLIDYAAGQLNLAGEIECSITFVDNKRIQVINREYRSIDQPTDVISFALEEMGADEVPILREEGAPRVLGDIIISVERAHEQAVEYNHSFERELGFLVVHGLLHLLGYDHQTKEQEKEMFGLQERILSSFGLSRG